MDRERLKQVERADLNESRVNEDFVLWLKNKGPSWLLVILIGMSAYLLAVKWRERGVQQRNIAWAEFYSAALPGSFEDVAEKHADVDQIARLAWLRAAEGLVASVQADRRIDAQPEDENPGLTPEIREQYLARAEGLYQKVLDGDDGSLALALHAGNAMNGLAAIAESRGDAEAAVRWYEQAAERLAGFYPPLAEQARSRAESAPRNVRDIVFLPEAEVRFERPTPVPARLSEVAIDPALEQLWTPEDEDTEQP